jgi:hypothetical protein
MDQPVFCKCLNLNGRCPNRHRSRPIYVSRVVYNEMPEHLRLEMNIQPCPKDTDEGHPCHDKKEDKQWPPTDLETK